MKSIASFKSQKDKIILNFVGDVMLGRRVGEYLEKYDYNVDLFTNKVKQVFEMGDFNVCNFEAPIGLLNNPIPNKKVIFSCTRKALDLVPFNVVNLANNHILDHDLAGLNSTEKALATRGIGFFGSREKTGYIPKSHPRIGFLGYSFKGFETSHAREYEFQEFDGVPSVFSQEKFIEDIHRMKYNGSEFIVVNAHWGTEYETRANDKQKALARFMVDNGANIIIGHHPHVQQEIEIYKDSLICYSLGNFIFDQDRHKYPGTEEGKIIQVILDRQSLEIIELIEYQTLSDANNFLVYLK